MKTWSGRAMSFCPERAGAQKPTISTALRFVRQAMARGGGGCVPTSIMPLAAMMMHGSRSLSCYALASRTNSTPLSQSRRGSRSVRPAHHPATGPRTSGDAVAFTDNGLSTYTGTRGSQRAL